MFECEPHTMVLTLSDDSGIADSIAVVIITKAYPAYNNPETTTLRQQP